VCVCVCVCVSVCVCVCVCMCMCVCVCVSVHCYRPHMFKRRRWGSNRRKGSFEPTSTCYGVATISRLLKIIGLFRRMSSLLLGSFAKETCDLKESTNRSDPIAKLRVPKAKPKPT